MCVTVASPNFFQLLWVQVEAFADHRYIRLLGPSHAQLYPMATKTAVGQAVVTKRQMANMLLEWELHSQP